MLGLDNETITSIRVICYGILCGAYIIRALYSYLSGQYSLCILRLTLSFFFATAGLFVYAQYAKEGILAITTVVAILTIMVISHMIKNRGN